MLRIRDAQLAAIERTAVEDFVRRLLPELRESWPTVCEGLAEDELFATALASVDYARGHGIVSDACVSEYLHVVFLFGPAFPHRCQDGWARALVEDAARDERTRVLHLRRAALSRVS